jgi:LPXTG-motif cell wall-anchored protein
MSFEPGISSVDSDGTDCGLIANGGYYGTKRIAIESGANFIYSTQYTNLRRFPAIAGSSPTGESGTNLTLTGLGSFTFTSVNDMAAAGGKLYMAVSSNTSKAIIEVTLDETTTSQQARVLIQGETAVNNVQVDSVNNRIYWGTGSAVRRAVLSDGSGITTVATGQYSWAVPVPAESKIVAGGYTNPTVMDMSGNILGTLNIDTNTIPVPIVFTLTGQTVTWSPNTNLDLSDSPATPSALAASSGPGAIQYSVLNAGTTGCTVIPSTGVLTFATVGTCVVRATTAASGNYASGNADVLFVIADRNATTTTAAAVTTTTAAAVTTTPLLPATGQDTSSGSLVAFFLIVTGLAMLVLGVRRRSAVH